MEHVEFYLTGHMQCLLDAMVRAEGGEEAFLKAIRCSKPACASYGEALAIGCKTVRSRMLAFQEWGLGPMFVAMRHKGADPWTGEESPRQLIFSEKFIRFLGERWAPVGVMNDPTHLNENWVPNVTAIYHQLVEERDGDNGTESAGSRGIGGAPGTILPGSR